MQNSPVNAPRIVRFALALFFQSAPPYSSYPPGYGNPRIFTGRLRLNLALVVALTLVLVVVAHRSIKSRIQLYSRQNALDLLAVMINGDNGSYTTSHSCCRSLQ